MTGAQKAAMAIHILAGQKNKLSPSVHSTKALDKPCALLGASSTRKETAMQAPQPQQPSWLAIRPSLLNPNWRYVPAASTNIMDRFRAMGWVPPSEVKK
jgi:hypothetical protein